jgi:hypothetical protein
MATDNLGYQDTPILEDSGYHVHDGLRPQPPIVVPGVGTAPPSDAKVLFDGSSLDGWVGNDGPAAWAVSGGYMEVVPKTGNIRSRLEFGSCQLHVEFTAPEVAKGDGQGRGNSGVFMMGAYEIQVLDNYDNPTYADGTVGAIYGQHPPLANAIRKPGEWNVYDIIWEASRFQGQTLTKPAYVTVILNGIVLHHRRKLNGPTSHKALSEYVAHPPKGPVELQDHGDLVRFRNIWVRELPELDGVE